MTRNVIKEIWGFIELVLSMSGYVLKHASVLRTISVLVVLAFSFYLSFYQSSNITLAFIYFIAAEILYIGFIYLVLRENGYRRWFIKKWGEAKGFLVYEAILGFTFINNAISIGYMASATSGNLFDFVPSILLFVIVAILFIGGFIIKIMAAKATSIEIYYWKDMFLGRKICKFVVTGPYKYFNNPMYGVGQLQAYAMAVWYGSIYGLFAALINQCLVFSFYYTQEKKFINTTYMRK